MNIHEMPMPSARILFSGFPGSGKTGALAALANAGWKLRIIDLDGNFEVLKNYVKPTADVDICSFEDPLRMGARTMGPDGIPTAFHNADSILDRWRYKGKDDAWVDLGASKNWGPDTIVCLDGLTGLTQACWYRAQVLTGTTATGDQRRVYQTAADEQLAFIRRLTSASNKYHTIVISHLKIIGPPEIGRSDEEPIKEAKRFAAEAIPTRLYPTAVGRNLALNIAGEFPTHIRAMAEDIGGRIKRTINYSPTPEVDIKLPAGHEALAKLGKLEAADGLPRIFAALGHNPPEKPNESRENETTGRKVSEPVSGIQQQRPAA